MSKAAIEDRFWKHVIPIPEAGCWIWDQESQKSRYGSFKVSGKVEKAHRVSWMIYRGPIPDGLNVLHKCDIGFCVNPDHLFLGTHQDNMDDKERKGRGNQPCGLRHGSRTKPERTCRGDQHPARIRPLWRAGERNGRAVLTADDVREIRQSPVGHRPLARAYGVTHITIMGIRSRRLWRHI